MDFHWVILDTVIYAMRIQGSVFGRVVTVKNPILLSFPFIKKNLLRRTSDMHEIRDTYQRLYVVW